MTIKAGSIERSIKLYGLFNILSSAYFWTPVFILYFSQTVPLRQVFFLEAVYYLSVFAFEIPSGYFSDRIGRKATLLLASVFFMSSYMLFFIGGSFAVLAAAEVLLAAGFAFVSGTDTSLHWSLLEAAGRSGEYGQREASLASKAFIVTAAASITGGLIATAGEYRLAYLLSFAFAAVNLLVLLFISETATAESSKGTEKPGKQLKTVFKAASGRNLRWFFSFAVLITVINHVPYEFFQIYIRDFLEGIAPSGNNPALTPLFTGIHSAAAMITASFFASRFALRLKKGGAKGLSDRTVLLSLMLVQLILIAALQFRGYLPVVILLLARSIPSALSAPIIRSETAPHLPPSHMATYFSVQSFCGRLAFALSLVIFGLLPGDGYHSALTAALVIAAASFIGLTAWARRR